MEQAWKSINGFIVSLTSSFDQLKLWFYTEIKKNPEKTSLKTVNHHREGIFTFLTRTVSVYWGGPVHGGINI